MIRILQAVILLLLLRGLWFAWLAHGHLRLTTLTMAAKWTIAAIFMWCVAAGASWFVSDIPAGVVDQLWYWTMVVSCCPPIAVLGARSPTHRVWNYFILMPLVAVLGWPAMTLWMPSDAWQPVEVGGPVLMAFGLVTVMGFGNFVGTRYTAATFLAGLAVVAGLVPFATFRPESVAPDLWRICSATLIVLAGQAAISASKRQYAEESPYTTIWNDFRDTFGLVWSVRILERLQEQGRRDQLPVEWSAEGLHWCTEDESAREAAEVKISHTLRWLLRRFVEPEWIDARGVPRVDLGAKESDPSRLDS
ncbi:MAG: hypothetical protein KDA88_00230 [Planctomycetaceae bacterium]|nr:hypothetical protein [Planctomycetaceae bacterium]MCB9950281.1 hypothetical protein [Planctomycetaceae bacterium]